MGADEIWASPTTITGSIGVGAAFPTFSRSLDQLGVNVDGLGTTTLAGQTNPLRELGPEINELIGLMIQNTYDAFIGRVAEFRDKDLMEVDGVARGRVWVATDAQAHGLVDELGDLADAIASSAELAGLEEDDYQIEYVQRNLSIAEMIALQFARISAPLGRTVSVGSSVPAVFQTLLDAAGEPFRLFELLNDPRDLYLYCFCDIR